MQLHGWIRKNTENIWLWHDYYMIWAAYKVSQFITLKRELQCVEGHNLKSPLCQTEPWKLSSRGNTMCMSPAWGCCNDDHVFTYGMEKLGAYFATRITHKTKWLTYHIININYNYQIEYIKVCNGLQMLVNYWFLSCSAPLDFLCFHGFHHGSHGIWGLALHKFSRQTGRTRMWISNVRQIGHLQRTVRKGTETLASERSDRQLTVIFKCLIMFNLNICQFVSGKNVFFWWSWPAGNYWLRYCAAGGVHI